MTFRASRVTLDCSSGGVASVWCRARIHPWSFLWTYLVAGVEASSPPREATVLSCRSNSNINLVKRILLSQLDKRNQIVSIFPFVIQTLISHPRFAVAHNPIRNSQFLHLHPPPPHLITSPTFLSPPLYFVEIILKKMVQYRNLEQHQCNNEEPSRTSLLSGLMEKPARTSLGIWAR